MPVGSMAPASLGRIAGWGFFYSRFAAFIGIEFQLARAGDKVPDSCHPMQPVGTYSQDDELGRGFQKA